MKALRCRVIAFAAVLPSACLVFVSCNFHHPGKLPDVTGRILNESSQDWGRITLTEQHCALVNNVWNSAAAGGALRQEVFVEEAGGKIVPGWRWSSPWHFLPRVVSQPQLVCGDKPWDMASGLRSDFPFRAGSKRLTADFKTSIRASGVYNMTFTMWAVSSLPPSRSGISHEIMIWTVNHGQVPAGSAHGTLEVNGTTFDEYVETRHADASGANTNTWMYVAFVARTLVLNGPLDLDGFIDHMLQRGLLTEGHFLTSVELGSEVSQGAGTVELQDFSLTLADRD